MMPMCQRQLYQNSPVSIGLDERAFLRFYVFTFLNIDEAVIYKKLSELKLDKSPGPDNFHPRVLFELRNEICKPLQTLFDLSLQTGKTPTDWRSAVITALHKKGSKADVSNYRPVSLTCVICKVME